MVLLNHCLFYLHCLTLSDAFLGRLGEGVKRERRKKERLFIKREEKDVYAYYCCYELFLFSMEVYTSRRQ